MRRLLLLLLALFLSGCGGMVKISGAIPPGNPMVVRGTVSSVQLSAVPANGSMLQVTVVGLQSGGITNQISFCGNTMDQFPMNTMVTVNFNPGQNCNQIAAVIRG